MAYRRSKRSLERAEYDPLDPAKQHEPASAGALVSKLVDGKVLAGTSDTSRALVTWRRIAGKRAAKHTVSVWLNRAKKGTTLPELVVYLDGNALMADLSTNAELFVERLAYAGLEVSGVRFRLSRKAGQGWVSAAKGAEPARAEPSGPTGAGPRIDPELAPVRLEPLTPLEEARVRASCEALPDELRQVASEAMRLSLQRQKALGRHEG